MAVPKTREPVRYLLWAKTAGRCQFDGCNALLYQDDHTQIEGNFGVPTLSEVQAARPAVTTANDFNVQRSSRSTLASSSRALSPSPVTSP
jgi:hypothetical protein